MRTWLVMTAWLLTALLGGSAFGQGTPLVMPTGASPLPAAPDLSNPLALLAGAADALPTVRGGATGAGPGAAAGGGSGGGEQPAGGLSTAINILIVLTVIGLVPSIMLMCTCFLRIVIVLGLLKQALGAGQMPPSQVLLGLALIMTMLVMAPTAQRINDEALVPWRSGQITTYDQLWQAARKPLHEFMYTQIAATGNWSSLYMVMNYRGIDTSRPETIDPESIDMVTLIPAFVLSEMKVAFLMGFRVYLPFLVIDMVISALLISMSMMMLPPVLISLPFKLLLFVLVDGWQLVCGSLMTSFVQPGGLPPEALSGVLPATDAALRLAEQAAAVGPVGVLNAVRAGLV
ncbi:MAG: flagellar type III secretion system pore protein FliP [Planctomycetaceae bacterium]|jgi:flagellar biosynthetic protein FliP|nr:flagellar type III secretion system pore protein FliP [Planctomycetaceae bacterium]